VQKAIPALAYLASLIGDPAVRYRGTIGGSIANNDPAADYPAAVLALGATVKTNKRSIAADDFFKGLFSTALAKTARSSPRSRSRFRPRRAIPKFPIRPRASR
jgi:CO/xanthine dehydrogenase FAD-binding subunit